MKYELLIALRYIFSRRREKFISIVTLVSVLGIAVGVAALIATLSVMSGFDNELKTRIVGLNPHIFIEQESGIQDTAKLLKYINSVDGVKGSFPYIWSQTIIEFRGRTKGVILKSVDTKNEIDYSKLSSKITAAAPGEKIEDGLILGSELAASMGVFVSDEVNLITPASPKPRSMKVTGIFKSGMYDYDANIVYADFQQIKLILGPAAAISGIGVDCNLLAGCDDVKAVLKKTMGSDFGIWTWSEKNRNLFSAIKLEKLAMFIILTLIVVVACFSIIGVLVMTVMEKAKDIGILKSMGVPKKGIVAIFSIQGFAMGAAGVVLGFLSGAFISFLLEKFLKLPQDVYYIDTIPIKFSVFDSSVIAIAALALSVLAAIYPAYQASKLDPVEALRYE